MTKTLVTAAVLLVSGTAVQPIFAQAQVPDTVHVAPPTGETVTDRASILTALEEVEPGGTVLFGSGTYLVGAMIRVEMPRLTLLGHPAGTTLRGCERAEFEQVEARIAAARRPTPADLFRCGLFELTGGHVTVRNLTFELSRMGLMLGCCTSEFRFRESAGGYRIEQNTFRASVNGVRPILSSSDPTVIRDNRFIDTFHAISAAGRHIHFLDNDISVPHPSRVPGIGHPSFAISFEAVPRARGDTTQPPLNSELNIIAGNRIEGHPEGIVMGASAGDVRRNEIRDNTVVVTRVPRPSRRRPEIVAVGSEADSTIVGVPLRLYRSGAAGRGSSAGATAIEDNVIEGNRLSGADGVGLILDGGRDNRLVNNTITGIRRREPFPGNTLTASPEPWRAANGSGIWIAPGSDGNEIVGNTFEDVAGAEVFLEGDNNRVELRSPSDSVRDMGSNNRVTALDPGNDSARRPIHESESPDTVTVAAPALDHDVDRANILAAIEGLEPGGGDAPVRGRYLENGTTPPAEVLRPSRGKLEGLGGRR